MVNVSIMSSYLSKLEFDEIRQRVAECSVSVEAKARLLEETPLFDAEKAAELKRTVSAVVDCMNSGDTEPREDLPCIGGVLSKLAVSGGALEPDEALAIGLFVERGGRLKHWLCTRKGGKISPDLRLHSLSEKLNEIPDCSSIARDVFRVVN
ncbi:MAG: hypothetical protein LBH75_04335, partial [Treponema sp.]|nr:hypothetical protein [Treponema sp.]